MILRNILVFIATLLVLINSVLSQVNHINKINVDSSTISIYFKNLPSEFKSNISDDKMRVTIIVPNCDFDENLRSLPSNQIVKDVFLMHKDDSTQVIINLKDKFGYTSVPLPYSRSILVEFFKWDKLDKSEDLYREALLGIETGIYDKARENLEKAVDFGNPNASFYLGLLNLYDGKLKTAFKNLLFSANKNVAIPDLYAALSQILEDFNFNKEANYFKNIFSTKTGLKDYPKLIIGEIPEGDSLDKETIELLMKINLTKDEAYEKVKDTLNLKLKEIAKEQPDDVNANDVILTLFPEWFLDYIIYIIALILILAVILIVSYQRWKRKQLLLQKEKVIKINREFDDDLNEAQSTNTLKRKATEAYKKQETPAESEEKLQQIKDENIKESSSESKKSSPKVENQKPDEDFQTKIERLAQQITEIQEKKKIKELDNELEEKQEGIDAKTKLAMHLQEKNFLTKQELISKLSDLKIQDNQSISKLAQKMKIEKSIIDTKSKIKSLNENTDKLQELKKKFKIDESNSKDNT